VTKSSTRSNRPCIAVYAIAKNEEGQLGRWVAAASEADFLMIADTGSTDETVSRARNLGVVTHEIRVDPFRFDQARNRALDLLPEEIDLCVSVDLDEVLSSGWRPHLEAAWLRGATKVLSTVVWHWSPEQRPLRSTVDRIHVRHGYRWESPVHERLIPVGTEQMETSPIEICHLRDPADQRPQYLGLLRLAIAERPSDGRLAHMLANELRMCGFDQEAASGFRHALTMTTPPNERLHSMLMLSYLDVAHTREWLLAACAEFPDRREPWCQLAQLHLDGAQWRPARAAAHTALAITDAPDDYLANVFAWGSWPDRVAARASMELGDYDWAHHHVRRVRDTRPSDPEIIELAELLNRLDSTRAITAVEPASAPHDELRLLMSLPTPTPIEEVDVLIPVLHRPDNVKVLVDSLNATTEFATAWFICDPDDVGEIQAVKQSGANVILHAGSFGEKVNAAYPLTSAPWLLLVGDDVRFLPGWLGHALDIARLFDAQVVGTNDLSNPRVLSGDHATHPLIARSYVDQLGSSWDGPGVVCHEGYRHSFVDDEIVTVAKQRGTFHVALRSHVEHLHPLVGKAKDDNIYRFGEAYSEQDRQLFCARLNTLSDQTLHSG
jgi:glycosyltransferase involved in cell wall biosynthesis